MASTPPHDRFGSGDGKGDESVKGSVASDPLTPHTPVSVHRRGPPLMLPPSEETPPKPSLPKNNMNTTMEPDDGEDSDFNELPESEESQSDSVVEPGEIERDFDEYEFVYDSRLCHPDPAGGYRCPHCHAHSEGLFHRCPAHYLERGLAVPPGVGDSSPKTEDCFDSADERQAPESEDEHASESDDLEI